MKRERELEEAVRLRDEGATYQAIADRFGVTAGCVWKWLHPERAREWSRAEWARPERRAAQRAHARRARKSCADCGGEMGPGSAWRNREKRCWACEVARRQRRTAERGHQIEQWWAEGLLLREIADRLGWSAAHVGVEIDRLREKGFDLPYRHRRRERAA